MAVYTWLTVSQQLPKPKAPTRWEKFAEQKGISNTKRERMVYDELTQEYRPRFGYKRAGDKEALPWIEVPDNAGRLTT